MAERALLLQDPLEALVKVTRSVDTPVHDQHGRRWPLVTYIAEHKGLYGIGPTPEKAVLDLRHEYRSFVDLSLIHI